MWFFKRPKSETAPQSFRSDLGTAIEIVAHKEAAKEEAQRAKAANKQLQRLLVENGFTLKIYLAAGGSPSKAGNSKKA